MDRSAQRANFARLCRFMGKHPQQRETALRRAESRRDEEEPNVCLPVTHAPPSESRCNHGGEVI